jgi:hypothetical protein
LRKAIYKDLTASIKRLVKGWTSLSLRSRVRLRCPLLPLLFNIVFRGSNLYNQARKKKLKTSWLERSKTLYLQTIWSFTKNNRRNLQKTNRTSEFRQGHRSQGQYVEVNWLLYSSNEQSEVEILKYHLE